MNVLRVLSLLLTFCFSFQAYAQADSTKVKIIEGITYDILREYLSYVKAKEMTDFINHKFQGGGYDSTLNIDEFTYELTMDLRKISHDEHICVSAPDTNINWDNLNSHSKKKQPLIIKKVKKINRRRKFKKYLRKFDIDNFSYGQIKYLPGNIGYLEITNFKSNGDNKTERISIKSVMAFLKDANTIIIDLRRNTGGQLSLANYFCSFFSEKPHSYIITGEIRQAKYSSHFEMDTIIKRNYYTSNHRNFRFTKGKNIYILTSKESFSAAELTCYALKKLNKNVRIIGEQTRGGANGHIGPMETKYYSITIPDCKILDKDNNNYTWEAKGIMPDMLVDADSAFNIAYQSALKKTDKTILKDDTKYYKGRTELQTPVQEAISNPNDYIGNYRKVKILEKESRLILIYDYTPKEVLIPKGNDTFTSDRFKHITFIRNNNNEVISIRIGYNEKYIETFRKQ